MLHYIVNKITDYVIAFTYFHFLIRAYLNLKKISKHLSLE